VLEVIDLEKSYEDVKALQGVSFRAFKGQTLGLLGPNGAGKTTAISILVGILTADKGEVRIHGRTVSKTGDRQAKACIGLVPQDLALHEGLDARDNLALSGALYGLSGEKLRKAVDQALQFAGLEEHAKRQVSTYSGGMKRRLNLAAALLHEPELLVLDEPTVGVDPQSRNAIFESLEALKARGVTQIYTTHYMEEAERLCDRIVIIDHGRVLANDSLAGLQAQIPTRDVVELELDAAPDTAGLDVVRSLPCVTTVEAEGACIRIGLKDLHTGLATLLARLESSGLRILHVATARPDLETIFLALTGKALRD
jgi:ABC-2 type transport system ATP-binding protein